MKKILFTLCLLATAPVFAGAGFYMEFKMTMVGSRESANGSIKVYNADAGVSRSELSMKIPGLPVGAMNMVSLHKVAEPTKVYMINEEAKTYSVTDLAKFRNIGDPKKNVEHKYEVTVVGTEKVNGYNATHVKVKVDGLDIEELWTSKDIAGYEKYAQLNGSKYSLDNSLWAALKANGAAGFPVRIVMLENSGKMQVDLVKAEKRDIASTLITIPAEYKQVSTLDGIMQQMGMPTKDDMLRMTPEQREQMMREMEQKYKSQQ